MEIETLLDCAAKYSDEELISILRAAGSKLFLSDMYMSRNQIIEILVEKYGFLRTNVLLGHARPILALYEDISKYGYSFNDALQDYIDGKE